MGDKKAAQTSEKPGAPAAVTSGPLADALQRLLEADQQALYRIDLAEPEALACYALGGDGCWRSSALPPEIPDPKALASLLRELLTSGGRQVVSHTITDAETQTATSIRAVGMEQGPQGLCALLTLRRAAASPILSLHHLDATQRAEELYKLRSALFFNITHEVRTPLTVILGFTSMLRQGVREEYQRFVRVIERSGRRLLLMLDSFLDLAQLESGTLEIDRARFDVLDVVHAAAESFRPLIEERGLELRVVYPAERIHAPRGHRILDRVLSHLLDNAIKFTDKGAIELSVEKTGDFACITIRDTGIGIDSAFLPHIFDEFSQESNGMERTHQGSGLGLAVTKRLLDLTGGSIEVDSRKGQGSSFKVLFPTAEEALAA